MYAIKVAYGDVGDEPEMATIDIIGSYETWDEACEAAEDKFKSILHGLIGTDICFGGIASSQYDHYVTYGDHDVESGRVVWGYDYYYYVNVVKR